jgi:stress response protein YsnF
LKPLPRRTASAKQGAPDRARAAPAPGTGREQPAPGATVVPLVREEVAVGKRSGPTGKVQVRKIVRERVATIDEPVEREEIVVERVPIGRLVSEPIPPRQEGDTLVLAVIDEVIVKQLRLVEEVRITKRRRRDRRTTTMPLRYEEIVVDRTEPAASADHPAAPTATPGGAPPQQGVEDNGQDDRRNV